MALAPTSGKRGPDAPPERARGRGFQRPSEIARAQLGRAASAHGFAEPDVLLRWPEIVGESLSGLCEPVRVTYPRDHGLAATLIVRCAGARAPEVEHLGPRIVERVNQFYGYRAIARIRVTQTTGPTAAPAGGLAEGPAPFRHRDAPSEPDAATTAEAGRLADGIRDPVLREALTRMGAHVLTRTRT